MIAIASLGLVVRNGSVTVVTEADASQYDSPRVYIVRRYDTGTVDISRPSSEPSHTLPGTEDYGCLVLTFRAGDIVEAWLTGGDSFVFDDRADLIVLINFRPLDVRVRHAAFVEHLTLPEGLVR